MGEKDLTLGVYRKKINTVSRTNVRQSQEKNFIFGAQHLPQYTSTGHKASGHRRRSELELVDLCLYLCCCNKYSINRSVFQGKNNQILF